MKKRVSPWVLSVVTMMLAPCVLCGGGLALNNYVRMQNYRKDVVTLRSIAQQLGYTPSHHFRSYRSHSVGTSDVLTLVFWTDLSLEEFSRKVDGLGFPQIRYFGDDARRGNDFLEEVNHGAKSRKMTINGHDTVDNLGFRHPSIKATQWELSAPDRRELEIEFGRSVYSEDQFMIDGKAISGNVVIVAYWRRGDWTDIYFRYPDPRKSCNNSTHSPEPEHKGM